MVHSLVEVPRPLILNLENPYGKRRMVLVYFVGFTSVSRYTDRECIDYLQLDGRESGPG